MMDIQNFHTKLMITRKTPNPGSDKMDTFLHDRPRPQPGRQNAPEILRHSDSVILE